jgi:hypothetical protein
MEEGFFVKYGEIDRRFESYGLYTAELYHNDKRLPLKAVIKQTETGNTVVGIVSRGYVVLPNKYVLELTEEIVRSLGLEFSNEIIRLDKRNVNVWHRYIGKIDSHTVVPYFEGEYDTRLFINVTFPNEIKIGDEIFYKGIQIRNSEDGSLAFGIDAFLYRLICKNGAVVKEVDVKASMRHTKQLREFIKKEKLMEVVNQVMRQSEKYIKAYSLLRFKQLSKELAEKLVEKFPKKYLPPYIKAEEDRIELLKTPTVWEVYNDLTQAIWHNTRISMLSKCGMFNTLHKILEVRA